MNDSNFFQNTFNQMVTAAKEADLAPKQPLRLGALTDALAAMPHGARCVMETSNEFQWDFGTVDSYRGYYSDLALEPGDNPATVDESLVLLRYADGNTYTGYKGGEYYMDDDTLVWVSAYGECWGALVTGVENRDGLVVITTTPDED